MYLEQNQLGILPQNKMSSIAKLISRLNSFQCLEPHTYLKHTFKGTVLKKCPKGFYAAAESEFLWSKFTVFLIPKLHNHDYDILNAPTLMLHSATTQ